MKALLLIPLISFWLTAEALEPIPKAGLWETVLKNRQIETAVDQPNARFGKNKGPEPQSAPSANTAAQSPGQGPGQPGTGSQSSGIVEKVCVSSDALVTVGMPATIRRDCEYKTRWSGTVAIVQTFCNGVVTSGEVTYPNSETYSGWILPSAPWGMGRIEISGRWISADCGSIKP